MSAMNQMHLQIQELIIQGLDAQTISTRLNVPIEWVYAVEDVIEPDFAN